MHIISYGCSYTAGSEMLDHLIDPRADKIKHKKGLSHWYQTHRAAYADEEHLRIREGEMAWPGQIAQRLGASLDNRALGGSGLAHAIYLIEQAWYRGDFESEDVRVLVGVTNHGRNLYWMGTDRPVTWLLGHPHTWPRKRWHHHTVLSLHSDQYLLTQHLTGLLRLCAISDRLQGRLIMFDMTGQLHSGLECVCGKDHSFWQRWREIIDSGHTRFDHNLHDEMTPGECYGGLHPKVSVHERFADWAVDQLA